MRYYDPSGYTPTLNSEYDISLIDGDGGNEENNVVDVLTGKGYGAGDQPVRIEGEWSENDLKQALLGHPPRGLGSPDIHHGGQLPGAALHEVPVEEHRNNSALHPNKYNQGVTDELRKSDRELHWWYRAREQGADQISPNWIYDNSERTRIEQLNFPAACSGESKEIEQKRICYAVSSKKLKI